MSDWTGRIAEAPADVGFVRLAGADTFAVLGDPQPVWRAFAATWEDLGPDHYRADGGRHRQSRDATFDVTGS
jgi:hypothetical protein